MILEYKFSFDLFVSYHYSIPVSTEKIEYTVHSTIGLLGWNLLKCCFKQLYSSGLGEKQNKKSSTIGERSNIIFINKADSKVSLEVNVCSVMIRSDHVFNFRFPSMWQKNCDYRFQSIKLTNQSTNIEYYRVLSINWLHFRWSISID